MFHLQNSVAWTYNRTPEIILVQFFPGNDHFRSMNFPKSSSEKYQIQVCFTLLLDLLMQKQLHKQDRQGKIYVSLSNSAFPTAPPQYNQYSLFRVSSSWTKQRKYEWEEPNQQETKQKIRYPQLCFKKDGLSEPDFELGTVTVKILSTFLGSPAERLVWAHHAAEDRNHTNQTCQLQSSYSPRRLPSTNCYQIPLPKASWSLLAWKLNYRSNQQAPSAWSLTI